MDLQLITAPAASLVTLTTLKEHLRFSSTAEDTVLQAYLDAAVAFVDGRAGALRRALVSQTWDYSLDDWPAGDCIELPLPPLISVTSVKYYDETNTQQTLSSALYVVRSNEFVGRIELISGESWPSLYDRANPITIRFVAGYGAAASDVPAPIRVAAMLRAADLFANRGDAAGASDAVADTIERLLRPYRVPYAVDR